VSKSFNLLLVTGPENKEGSLAGSRVPKPQPFGSLPVSQLERSRLAADATREANGSVIC